jgi:hypothetical protein
MYIVSTSETHIDIMGSSNTKDSRLGGEDENVLLVLALGNFLYRQKNVVQGKIK